MTTYLKDAELVKTDRYGTKTYRGYTDCPRCDGRGYLPQYAVIDGGVCYECGGAKVKATTEKVYTEKRRKQLDAQREKRYQKKLEEERIKEAERAEKEAERMKKCNAKVEASRKRDAQSDHIGDVGEMLEAVVTVEFVTTYERPSFSGYGTDIIFIYKMRDDAGNLIIFKTGGTSFDVMKNDIIKVRGRIKEHGEYKGAKQTIIQRAKTLEEIACGIQ